MWAVMAVVSALAVLEGCRRAHKAWAKKGAPAIVENRWIEWAALRARDLY